MKGLDPLRGCYINIFWVHDSVHSSASGNVVKLSASIAERVSEYENPLDDTIYRMLRTVPTSYEAAEYGAGRSHSIWVMHPAPDDSGYEYISTSSVMTLVTPHVGHKVGLAICWQTTEGALHLYRFLLRHSETATAAGWVFETRVHLIFQGGSDLNPSPLHNATASLQLTIKADESITSNRSADLGPTQRLASKSRKIHPERFGVYMKPGRCNLTALDSLVIVNCPVTGEPMVVMFQTTISVSHPVKPCGLESLWEQIPAEAKTATPAIIFVIPKENVAKFKRQPIVPSVAAGPFRAWRQYVLPLSMAELWQLDPKNVKL
ncbi:hypothetical protein FN846DRAFT_998178 [Sphaerosporella brunnea]|uniref:Uncharacterized protein n=1 Tax=Sphaerosporella brunnea TaxID=1250544 RepID=A0A5J5EIT2_9PEZI|nr:hypothetical protein FN846DRAFT_998178 [Sphaerosporella brunnea]